MTIAEIMIIVWAIVIALSLFIEFLSYTLISVWFAPAALAALIMAAINTWIGDPYAIPFWAQIIVFIVLSLVFILTFRPIMRKVFVKDTIPTNITDSNIGKKLRLTSDMVDGHATIELNGVTWKVEVESEENLPKESYVELTGSISNKFTAKPVKNTKPETENTIEEVKEEKPKIKVRKTQAGTSSNSK